MHDDAPSEKPDPSLCGATGPRQSSRRLRQNASSSCCTTAFSRWTWPAPGRRSAPPTRKPRPRCTSWAPWPPNPWSPPGTRGCACRWTAPSEDGDGPVDMIVVPGGPGVERASAHGETRAWLRRRDAGTRRSVCTGAFLLASAGLLDGRVVTTHWRSADRLRQLYPALRVEDDRLYVDSGKYWTSAGVSAGIDLAWPDRARPRSRAVAAGGAPAGGLHAARRRPAPVQPDPAAAGPRRRARSASWCRRWRRDCRPAGRSTTWPTPATCRAAPSNASSSRISAWRPRVLRMLRRERAGAVQASGKMSKKEMERHLGPLGQPWAAPTQGSPAGPVRGRAGLMRPVRALLPCGIQQTFRD